MKAFEQRVNSNKNRNTRFVKVKETRICRCCGQPILKSNKCLTTNIQGIGRQWQCMKCTRNLLNLDKTGVNYTCETYRNIRRTEAELNNVAFGDEGAYMALTDYLDEQIARCLDCGRCSFSEMI